MSGFRWNEDKNRWLKINRNIGFEEIIQAVEDEGLLGVFAHPQPDKYPSQQIMHVLYKDYIYVVPYVIESDSTLFLKTIYPSRKAKKNYKLVKKDEKQ